MKNKISTLLLMFASLLAITCNKPKSYTLTGHIYERCGIPASNKTFTFYQTGGGGGILGTAITDVTGSFVVTYNELNSNHIKVGIPSGFGYSEYGEIDNSRLSDVKLYNQPTTFLRVGLQVYNTTYTNKDTLYVSDLGGSITGATHILKLIGPFRSGVLYEIPSYKILNYYYPVTKASLRYKINNGNYIDKLDTIRVCDTTNFVAEIK